MNCLVCKFPFGKSSILSYQEETTGTDGKSRTVIIYRCSYCGAEQKVEQTQMTSPTKIGFSINAPHGETVKKS